MIARTWRGWARSTGADDYARYFREQLLPELRRIPGFVGADLLRRTVGDEIELRTVTWFESIDAVRRFAGDDPERAVVSAEARVLLARFDAEVQHFEVAASVRS